MGPAEPVGTLLEETITGWNDLEARDWGSQVDDNFSAKGDFYICDVHVFLMIELKGP